MSWLDLPPDENERVISLTSASTPAADTGLARVALSLVGAGLVGFATEFGLELWKPADPARLASVLGIGIVERIDVNAGFAECAHLDPQKGLLLVRSRNPHDGSRPREFQVHQGTFPDESLDPWGRWQLDRMADACLTGQPGWTLREAGYNSSQIGLTFAMRQGRIVIEGRPPEITRSWKSGIVGQGAGTGGRTGSGPVRTMTLGRIRPDAIEAVRLLVLALQDVGLRPWEITPVWAEP